MKMAIDLSGFVEVKETDDIAEVNNLIKTSSWAIIDTYTKYQYANDKVFTFLMYVLGRYPVGYEGMDKL